MKNVWETCVFSDEIVTGHLELHKFAVELHDVIAGTADSIYQDPGKFLDNTYLTSQMRSILEDSLNRTEHSMGVPCIIIDTGFGGGKTHTLMLLYHIFSNPKIGFDYIQNYNLDRDLGIDHIADVQVAAIDCRDIKKSTLWGEIAAKLDKYDTVKEYDESKTAISNLDIIKNFFDKPTVLMIDELPHYLSATLAEKVGNTTKSKLTEDFLYQLISAVSSSKNSMLVLTLTENQQLYKDRVDGIKSTLTDYVIDGVINDLKATLSRQTSIINPMQKEEIYNVLRRRLVKDIDEKEKQSAIQEYMDYYTDQGLITDPKFRERLEKSYPIHPDLVDILYGRVSTISEFNQTRGTLRFLALVLNDVYEKQCDCTLVSAADINLESSKIADEITSKINRNEFAKIIDTDCIEHARGLDRDKPIKVIERIARTIYLHSLHETSNKKSGIPTNQIKLSVGRPGFDTSIIEKSLYESIRTWFWYIQETNDQFYFMDAVNENAIIAEHANRVDISEIDEHIHLAITSLTKESTFKPIIWGNDVEDSTSLKLYVFKYSETLDIKTSISQILGYVNNKPRNYPNTIAFVYADQDLVHDLKSAAKELAAIYKAKKDERIKADDNFLKNIIQKEARAKGNLSSMCIRTYCNIGYPDGPIPRLDVMSHGDMTSDTIGGLAREFLRSKGKLINEIGYDAIQVDSYKKLENIYNEFLSDKSKKFVEQISSILDAARDGVKQGIFGYGESINESEQRHEGIISIDVDVKYSGYIINNDYLKESKTTSQTTPNNIEGDDDQSEPLPSKHKYKICINTLEDIISNIDVLLVGNFKETHKELEITIGIVGNTKIELSGQLGDLTAIKNIVKNLRSYQKDTCSGYLTLSSDSDISDVIQENGMVYE